MSAVSKNLSLSEKIPSSSRQFHYNRAFFALLGIEFGIANLDEPVGDHRHDNFVVLIVDGLP